MASTDDQAAIVYMYDMADVVAARGWQQGEGKGSRGGWAPRSARAEVSEGRQRVGPWAVPEWTEKQTRGRRSFSLWPLVLSVCPLDATTATRCCTG